MPADLDDFYAALARQADTTPLAGVADARRRGQVRKRNRALATAAAVLLVIAGAGVVTWQRRHAEPILPATDPARIRGMEPVGEPLRLPDGQSWSTARISGTTVYGLSEAGVRIVDANTGEQTGTVNPARSASGSGVDLYAGPHALFVHGGEGAVFHDPVTGARLGKPDHTSGDRLLLHDEVIVERDIDGGLTAFDITDARQLWSAPAGADPLVAFGTMRTGPGSPSQHALPTGDRLVVVTGKGDVVIRDIRTGAVRTTVPAARPDSMYMEAHDGVVYTAERVDGGRWGIRATDTDAGSSVVVRKVADGNLSYFPCGSRRLCIYEKRAAGYVLVTVDATDGRVLREVPAPRGAGDATERAGRIMTSVLADSENWIVVLGEDGRQLADVPGTGGFIDDGNVLALVRDGGTGQLTARAISAVDGRQIDLGTVPALSGDCAWTAGHLVCPTGTELRIWRFVR
ncbi:PQQ-binding-like beta-propeller repeat protein [Actinoplanes sp. DH11]|uniref:outer membrane protein assembly factor BamB family protein n=1 Tax=Actinoplanes sp. DH11 TaxID=2857011 RepID=UPI001E4D5AEA|nr:PQQ-binding-like beta-propeller repeat protein [Actinoplanes sp. DH11]